MYECPNCGGNLKFDIPSQQLKCAYCLTTHDPYDITKSQDAEESSDFNVTIFTCPQCGGEILSADTSAAEFCSFCGASTILDSRISKEKRPSHIIPFKQTKEACKQAYIARMKHALFAPDELKDKKYIDGFRGIYMPYWAYSITQQGTVSLKGKKSYRRGDYVYTDHYNLDGEIDACYYDLSYDASSSFSDDISQRIAPFYVKDSKKFTPSYLSGFYADTADVDSRLYEKDAVKLANTTSYNKIKRTPEFSDLAISGEGNDFSMTMSLHTYSETPERVLYPVWFMSYRKNGRVAYATVNGQNCKVAADIPVDVKKYTLGTVLLTIPIFVLLNLFLTIRPGTLLSCSCLLASLSLAVYAFEILGIYHKDRRTHDRGYLSRASGSSSAPDTKKDSVSLQELIKFHSSAGHGKAPGFIFSLAAILACICVWIINPVSDLWYYGGAVVSFVGILLTIVAIIQKYNVLATQKLPQFERHGGDDGAY
ncbi:MAG: hypothetical protein K2O16_11915 [Lachnospiraceae bacterium]|nr:hypothetical protein [Lachnospiraceae bacterium]